MIEVNGLHYRYSDGTEALRGVDFRLEEGETVILMGANGSGKTTFLLHLNGLLQGRGDITVCGLRMETSNLAEIRRRVGLVFQEPDEQLFMPTVVEDVAFGPLNQGRSSEEAIEIANQTLARVGLSDAGSRAPYHLSAGEKRRVALAGVLAMRPQVLVLDEPTMSLDPPGQRDLVNTLLELEQAKVIATHDVALARALGTRAVFFEKGRVACCGSVTDIVDRFHWGVAPGAGITM